jgi:(1->4)-alpha-D-glucan 1-alpha-D-glucosylmutase
VTPRATYRVQFHRDFPLARAEELVPYLDRLGISHIYASPITTAVPGSTHGYDVIDPTRVNPELGGEPALRSLVTALRRHGMGLVIDIVPNHMGVAGGHNPYWNDVLQHGQASQYASWFDIDWRKKLLLPILGAPVEEVLAESRIAIDRSGTEPMLTAYGEHRLPIRPEDQSDLPDTGDREALATLLDRQHYRLGWWRAANDELNWRRFFTINELACMRQKDDAVFEATHALYFRLWEEGLIDGVRIDHVDGLSDPAAYCRKLRERFDTLGRADGAPPGPAYIVIEKILASGEALPTDWGVDGTSGYDFMEQVSLILHEPAGRKPLERFWRDFSGRGLTFHEEELQARQDMLSWAFESQLSACVEAFHRLVRSAPETGGLTRGMLRRAIQRMLWVFPVYRTYGTGSDAPESDAQVRSRVRRDAALFTPPAEASVVDRILDWLAGAGPGDAVLAADAVRRFQQLSAPIAAKAVEDTAFYRYGALLSRQDVGFDAARTGYSGEEFHDLNRERAASFPKSMLAAATHDHKRGEDVRARLAVLSCIPDLWQEKVAQWDGMIAGKTGGVASADRYVLYQMVFGCWPDGLSPEDERVLEAYAGRLAAWQEKALREGKLRSSWAGPNQEYEGRAREFLLRLCNPAHSRDFLQAVAALVKRTAGATLANMLVQAGLRYTVPGMPDLYQGCELPDYSMVDPDNRRPVDFELRRKMLTGDREPHPKFELIDRLLDLRRQHPRLFSEGSYAPAVIQGSRAAHVLAFSRRQGGEALNCAFAIRCAEPLLQGDAVAPSADWWQDTKVKFGDGTMPAARLFASSPVFISVVDA